MDYLPHLFQVFVHLQFGPFESLLAQVDGFRQQAAALLESFCIDPFLQFDPFGFKKVTQVSEEFVFVYFVHNQ